jgi:hypothetical protein
MACAPLYLLSLAAWHSLDASVQSTNWVVIENEHLKNTGIGSSSQMNLHRFWWAKTGRERAHCKKVRVARCYEARAFEQESRGSKLPLKDNEISEMTP